MYTDKVKGNQDKMEPPRDYFNEYTYLISTLVFVQILEWGIYELVPLETEMQPEIQWLIWIQESAPEPINLSQIGTTHGLQHTREN